MSAAIVEAQTVLVEYMEFSSFHSTADVWH